MNDWLSLNIAYRTYVVFYVHNFVYKQKHENGKKFNYQTKTWNYLTHQNKMNVVN